MNLQEVLQQVNFDSRGLVAAIVQDIRTNTVLMQAYMNEEALQLTLEKGEMYYYSRSRQQLWHKGATSGHFQDVKEVRIDCDGDVLLFKVEQGGGACHAGYRSCFFRKLEKDAWEIAEEKCFDEKQVYSRKTGPPTSDNT